MLKNGFELAADSDPADSTLHAYLEHGAFDHARSKPEILTPRDGGWYPADTHVLISGTCQANAKVEVFDSDEKIGDAVVVGTRWFYYRVWGLPSKGFNAGWWLGSLGRGPGPVFLTVVETVNGSSSASDPRIFGVGLLRLSPTPEMLLPADGCEYPIDRSKMFLLGTCAVGALIDVAIDGEWHSGYAAAHNGEWFAINISSYPRTVTYQARQMVPGYVMSKPGPIVTVKYVALDGKEQVSLGSEGLSTNMSLGAKKPPIPTIDSPVDGSMLKMDFKNMFKGTCEEGATVTLEMDGMEIQVWTNGKKWYCFVNSYLDVVSAYRFRVKQRTAGGESDWSEIVTTYSQVFAPLILFPLENSSHPVDGFLVSGICDKPAVVEIFNADNGNLLGTAVVKNTTWVFDYKWSKGSHRVMAKQSFYGNTSGESTKIEFTLQ